MKNEKWDDVHGNTTPDDRMVAFLESPTDSYAILQLREDVDDNIPLMFANYSYLQKKEMEPEIDRYEVVYHGSISASEDVNRQLEDLYVKFNPHWRLSIGTITKSSSSTSLPTASLRSMMNSTSK